MIHDWLKFFYDWPNGAIWGNVVVVSVLVPLGWVWSKTKFWPLRPIKHALHGLHTKLDAHGELLKVEHQRAEEHRIWQHQAHIAERRGEPIPPHPRFDS